MTRERILGFDLASESDVTAGVLMRDGSIINIIGPADAVSPVFELVDRMKDQLADALRLPAIFIGSPPCPSHHADRGEFEVGGSVVAHFADAMLHRWMVEVEARQRREAMARLRRMMTKRRFRRLRGRIKARRAGR